MLANTTIPVPKIPEESQVSYVVKKVESTVKPIIKIPEVKKEESKMKPKSTRKPEWDTLDGIGYEFEKVSDIIRQKIIHIFETSAKRNKNGSKIRNPE